MSQLKIELKHIIVPLSTEEYKLLEESLLSEGCRDSLIVWQEENILLDGHHRKEICDKYDIRYNISTISLPDKDAAEDWIDKNQLGRRNLNPDQMSILRGRIYNRMKQKHGGDRKSNISNKLSEKGGDKKSNHQNGDSTETPEGLLDEVANNRKTIPNEPRAVIPKKSSCQNGNLQKTCDKFASEYNVSRRTINRDGQIAEYLDKHPEDCQAVMRREKKLTDIRREIAREHIQEKLENIEAKEAKAIEGVYDVVVIDPPWPIRKIERNVRSNQVGFDYPTMGVDKIMDLKIPCADDCHVFLWTIQKFLPTAFKIFEHWGVKYVLTFVWHKNGGFQPFDLPQYNAEFIVYGRKGNPKFVDLKNFSACFYAKRNGHSRKPDEFYDMVRRVTCGRRIDMFGRRSIEGFEGWGNEV